jgi:hypothetical protein
LSDFGVRDSEHERTHLTTDGDECSERQPGAEEGRPPDAGRQGERLSRKQVLVGILIILLVAGALVAHLLTGPGVTH